MKRVLTILTIIFLVLINNSNAQSNLISSILNSAQQQVELMVDEMDSFDEIKSPRTISKDGSTQYVSLNAWTSGFFPGTLWYLYELTNDKKWLESAVKYTEGMERIKYYTGNHDIGFMIFCSFGNGLRLTSNEQYKDVIVTAAETLTKRYHPGAGIIQSWNSNQRWGCPVIIDNMMNLELLFAASQLSGDSKYWDIAVSHADNTIKNHFRDDNSTFHVVDYDSTTGDIVKKMTWQGYSDESAWARGQSWGLYGYTMCYRYTKDEKYLVQAEKIAHFMFDHENLDKDKIPYWDYDAPNPPTEERYIAHLNGENLRDASAAAISASALYELSLYAKSGKKYKKLADKIIKSLASPEYSAPIGENGNFILMHSTGNAPQDGEIDVPLIYADYYFLEALKRKREIENK